MVVFRVLHKQLKYILQCVFYPIVYQQSNFSCQKYQNLELENSCCTIPRLLHIFSELKLNTAHILHQFFFSFYNFRFKILNGTLDKVLWVIPLLKTAKKATSSAKAFRNSFAHSGIGWGPGGTTKLVIVKGTRNQSEKWVEHKLSQYFFNILVISLWYYHSYLMIFWKKRSAFSALHSTSKNHQTGQKYSKNLRCSCTQPNLLLHGSTKARNPSFGYPDPSLGGTRH